MVIESIRVCSGTSASEDDGLHYVTDRRAGGREAAGQAIRIAEQVVAADGRPRGDGDLDEQSLFRALKTCAYHASRCGAHQSILGQERCAWGRRWKVIRDYLVERNFGLVYATLARFHTGRPDWDELRSEALFALVRAVGGFNPERGVRFSTYACNAITHALIQAARRADKGRLQFVVGYNEWQERPGRLDVWSALYVDRLRRALELNSAQLTARESAVLAWRFAMNGGKRSTLAEVGRVLGVSREGVRMIQNRGLAKLRAVLAADPALQ